MKQWNPLDTLRRVVDEAGTQREAAKRLEISPAYLNDLLAGRRSFSERMLVKLGLQSVIIKSRVS